MRFGADSNEENIHCHFGGFIDDCRGGGVNAETLSYNDNDSGKFGITSDRSGNGDSLVINGNYKYGIVGQNNDVTVKDWSSISISLTNETIGQADVVGVIASKGKTTVVNTSGDLSITASGTAKEGTDPIPVHAYGGTSEIYAGGNIRPRTGSPRRPRKSR